MSEMKENNRYISAMTETEKFKFAILIKKIELKS